MAFAMSSKVPLSASALDHCQVTLDTSPSGSVTLAVIATPTRGCSCDMVTVPSSSTLVTVIFTFLVPVLLTASVASTVTSYTLSLSASPGFS